MGAIAGRRAKINKPANTKQAATKNAIEMRRVIVFFFQSVPRVLLHI